MGARKSAAADGIWSCLQSKGVGNSGGQECSTKGVVDLLGPPRSCAAEMGTFRERSSRLGRVCRIASEEPHQENNKSPFGPRTLISSTVR
jgi:hypothetical protein